MYNMQARAILTQAHAIFADSAKYRPNMAVSSCYISAMLEAKLGALQLKIIFSEHSDLSKSKVTVGLLACCKVCLVSIV